MATYKQAAFVLWMIKDMSVEQTSNLIKELLSTKQESQDAQELAAEFGASEIGGASKLRSFFDESKFGDSWK